MGQEVIIDIEEPVKLKKYGGISPKQKIFSDMWAAQRQMKKYHGSYPGGFIERVRENWIGDGEIVHVCSGTVDNGLTIDCNPKQRPTVVADAQNLPFKDDSLPNVIVDPPYDEENAKAYGFPYPKPRKLLDEAVRVTRPGGYVGMLHWLVMIKPEKTKRIAIVGITIGANMRIRCFSLFRKYENLDAFQLPHLLERE